jgi:putative transposase
VPAQSTSDFSNGKARVCLLPCGKQDWPSTTRWKALLGDGKASTGPCSRRRLRKSLSAPTRQIGEKKGSKRHLLVDGRGVPLSLVVTGANQHDVTQLDAVLQAVMVKRKTPSLRRSKHLCADAGYRGRRALEIIESHGYIPHVVGRRKEADAKRRNPAKKARRWVVEVCHSWFNRFRKLLVRYEKLHRSFIALNHIAAAIIAFRKVPLTINIIYG